MTPLPKDALLLELRPDTLTFATRTGLLPDTVVALALLLEGRPLELQAPVVSSRLVDRDRSGQMFHTTLSLAGLPAADASIIALFIGKGRGSPDLRPARAKP